MAEEFYLVKIGSVNLTIDGTEGGAACLNKVEGMAGLFLAHNGVTAQPISGLPFNFIRPNEGVGVRVITKPFSVKQARLDSIKTLINTANTGGSAIPVEISDGPGSTVNVDCDPLFEGGKLPIDFGPNFFNDELYDVEIRLITRGYTP